MTPEEEVAQRVIEKARATGLPGSLAYLFLLLYAELTPAEERHVRLCIRIIGDVEIGLLINKPSAAFIITGV